VSLSRTPLPGHERRAAHPNVPALYHGKGDCQAVSRRNLTAYQRAELALAFKPVIAAKAKDKQREGGESKVIQKSGEAPIRTDRAIAKAAGVSHERITKAEYVEKHADEQTARFP